MMIDYIINLLKIPPNQDCGIRRREYQNEIDLRRLSGWQRTANPKHIKCVFETKSWSSKAVEICSQELKLSRCFWKNLEALPQDNVRRAKGLNGYLLFFSETSSWDGKRFIKLPCDDDGLLDVSDDSDSSSVKRYTKERHW